MEKGTTVDEGREQLAAWEQSKPRDFFTADENIRQVLRMHLGATRYLELREELQRTGVAAATTIDRLARVSNRDENLPRLERFDGVGQRVEEVVFPAAYHELGRAIWRSGVLAALAAPGRELFAGALAYLLAHNGEAGHMCPVACTAGLIKLLQRVGSAEQKERLLPALLSRDYHLRLHGAQFVTEVQGGSDVGANGCRARPAAGHQGWYELHGEKWFCSVIDAGVFVVSARPEGAHPGTRGLGLFLVPRHVDGEINGFAIRRLKYKLGTRSLASAEVDFEGALAEPIGALAEGFKNLISIVLDTSRVHNAIAACGIMARALIEAETFSHHRRAFGRPIAEHPPVQLIIARIKTLTAAAVATTFRLLALGDRLAHHPDASLEQARRTHVNINKYWTAISCAEVVRSAIEVLGGNGTIEEFSVLPRLYRDTMVLESWEGTHNTLCAQVLRDFATRELHRPWLAEMRQAAATLAGEQARLASRSLDDLEQRIAALLALDSERAALRVRHVVDRMCVANSALSLALEARWEQQQGEGRAKGALLALYRHLVVEPPADPMADDSLPELLRAVAAGD